MLDWIIVNYAWWKSFHVISVIAWMAALLYLPRLYVYHAETAPQGSPQAATFEVMERKRLIDDNQYIRAEAERLTRAWKTRNEQQL